MKSSQKNHTSIHKLLFFVTVLASIFILSPLTSFGQSSVTLNWTATGDDGSTGTASAYDIRYSTSLISDANWSSATQLTGEPTPQSTGSAESFVVNSLSASTTYYFAMKTADEAFNWSSISNVVSKSTSSETIPPATIASLAISNPTDTSVTLSWTSVGDDGNTGQASQYEIRYATSPITSGNWSSATVVSNSLSPQVAGASELFVVNGLNQETTYYFAVKTADEIPNWSSVSNVVSSTTLDLTPPSAIIDLAAITGTDNGTISLNWTAPGDDNMVGVASLYEIRFSQNQITDSNWLSNALYISSPLPLSAGSSQTITLTGLTPGQVYFTGIKTYDNNGNASSLSNISSAEAKLNIATDIDDDIDNNLPTKFVLAQNYPNPFNPSTTIGFSLPTPSYVSLFIYNIEGKLVNTLVDQQLAAGNYSFEWDGRNSNGSQIATGVYIYRISTEMYSETKKMLLLK